MVSAWYVAKKGMNYWMRIGLWREMLVGSITKVTLLCFVQHIIALLILAKLILTENTYQQKDVMFCIGG